MRKRVLALAALTATTALLWSTLGMTGARGQDKPIVIGRAHEASFLPAPDGPVFILAIGTDAGGLGRPQNPLAGRADSIHIIALNPESGRGSVVGIPRDTYVTIPGRGRDRINSALTLGGMDLQVRTVEQMSGCTFDYWMAVGFQGFIDLVDDFGGVPVDVPTRMKDRPARIDLQPGEQTLTGPQALGFARSRKTAATPRGDIDRSRHQGELMLGALRKATAEASRDPGVALRFLGAVLRRVHTEIPAFEALQLGLNALRLDPDNVVNAVADGDITTIGGASVVATNAAGRATLADVCDDGVLGG